MFVGTLGSEAQATIQVHSVSTKTAVCYRNDNGVFLRRSSRS